MSLQHRYMWRMGHGDGLYEGDRRESEERIVTRFLIKMRVAEARGRMHRCTDVGLPDLLIRVLGQVSAKSCPLQAVAADVSLATPVEVKGDTALLQAL